jgi:type I restriction-modification system DNA methylase subunit
VNHDEQTNPYAQEVKVERGVNDGAFRKRADYAFYLTPNYRDVRFYVEAKRPSNDFASSDNYLQTIRYGWFTKKTSPFAVLTSFDDFHILDCRLEPDIKSTLPHVLDRFTYTDYADKEKFARIYWLFSREAIAGGSLEKYAELHPISASKKFRRGLFKGGDVEPDEAFLEELDGYRQKLAQAFKKNNPDLDGDLLTEVTQRTLDRLVFTRFLEDKGIETPQVENFGKSEGVWEDFISASLRLNRKYNGIVYRQHPRFDAPGFRPDEKVFARICEELSDPTSKYNFNSIPIHILGSIYERFLGKVISDSAKVVEKPEVRKAGGVYYTPEYIVRYIVENTVGKMIEGKTPAQIAEMKFADIACGSGSFLLGVFDVLLQYHAKYYSENPGKVKKGDCVRRDGSLHLSLQTKREILTNNIYGVDIDRQAVEVAQLSLYLKLLEDETVGSTSEFQTEFHFTLLPALDKNIVCGNSLIGPDILDGDKLSVDEEKWLNPMDYAQRFPQIFRRKVSGGELRDAAPGEPDFTIPGVPLHGSFSYKKTKKAKAAPETEYEGGFDAIVGNPPYVRPHNLESTVKEYFWQHYKTFTHKSDLYCCFMENATRLLKSGGLFSYIVSHGWLRLNSFQELRRFVLKHYRIRELVQFPYNVFAEAQVATGVFVFEKCAATPKDKLQVIGATPITNGAVFKVLREIPQQTFQETFQNVFDTSISPETEAIKDKMRQGTLIGSNFEICFGLKTADDDKFLHHTKGLHKEDRPLLRGDDVKRYEINYKGEYVWYVPKRMRAHRSTARPGEPRRFEQAKVLVKDTSSDFACTYEPGDYYVKDVLILIPKEDVKPNYNLKFVAAVINSKALHFYYRTTFQTIHVQNSELASLPLPRIDVPKSADKVQHDKLVALVDQMLEARKSLPQAKSERDREFYENKCATLDQQIDALVYDLYGLTDDEIKLVEGT